MDEAGLRRELVLLRGNPLSDHELAAQALAADPAAPLPDDAVSLWELDAAADADGARGSLLPDWYMPAPATGVVASRRWRRRVSVGLVSAFVLINAAGLCSTYGSVVIA